MYGYLPGIAKSSEKYFQYFEFKNFLNTYDNMLQLIDKIK